MFLWSHICITELVSVNGLVYLLMNSEMSQVINGLIDEWMDVSINSQNYKCMHMVNSVCKNQRST